MASISTLLIKNAVLDYIVQYVYAPTSSVVMRSIDLLLYTGQYVGDRSNYSHLRFLSHQIKGSWTLCYNSLLVWAI